MLKNIAFEWWHRARFLLSRMRSTFAVTAVAEPVVVVYRFDGRLVLEGYPPFRSGPLLGAVGSTGDAVLVPRDADDAGLADHVLRLIDECGAAVPTGAPTDRAVADALGLRSERQVIERAAVVHVLRSGDGEIRLQPMRKHPPGGWVGAPEEEVLVSGDDGETVGASLRSALDRADALPRAGG